MRCSSRPSELVELEPAAAARPEPAAAEPVSSAPARTRSPAGRPSNADRGPAPPVSPTRSPTAVALGLGATASALRFGASDAATSPDARTTSLFGASARATWSAPLGPIRIAVGPEVHAYPQPVSVQVGGAEVARIPVITAGLAALVELPLER